MVTFISNFDLETIEQSRLYNSVMSDKKDIDRLYHELNWLKHSNVSTGEAIHSTFEIKNEINDHCKHAMESMRYLNDINLLLKVRETVAPGEVKLSPSNPELEKVQQRNYKQLAHAANYKIQKLQ